MENFFLFSRMVNGIFNQRLQKKFNGSICQYFSCNLILHLYAVPKTHLLDFQIALQQFHFFLDGKHLFSLIQGNPVEAGQIFDRLHRLFSTFPHRQC